MNDVQTTEAPAVSVIMPVYNVERFVVQAIRSVYAQSFQDFELIIVDDGGSDRSVALCEAMADHRTRILHHANRGLAGARNTGIAAARGEFVALLDSDDMFAPDKLATHVALLRANPDVGVCYAGAELIDEADRPVGIRQRPLLGAVTARNVFCGQVIRNGSIPVFRKATLEQAALRPTASGSAEPNGRGASREGQRTINGLASLTDGTPDRVWYFDETLRQSEDVECGVRIALTTDWGFAGVPGELTRYRVNAGGLSADVIRQLASWERVYDKIAAYAPDFIAAHGREARARELRYLARRCFQMRDRGLAFQMAWEGLRLCPALLVREPVKTLTTLAACALLRLMPEAPFAAVTRAAGVPSA